MDTNILSTFPGWCGSLVSMPGGTSTSEVNNGSVVMFSYLVLDGFGEAHFFPLLVYSLFVCFLK